MNKKRFTLTIALATLLIQGVFANGAASEVEEFDLDSVVYIETEEVIILGFDTADYLPEGFDPYEFYFDLNWIEYIEESSFETIEVKGNLPKDFNPYSNPVGIQGINYIDPRDEITLDFEPSTYLPEDFDAYKK